MLMFDSYSELIGRAIKQYKESDDFDAMYDKLMFSIKNDLELQEELINDYLENNYLEEPWVRGKNGELELEGNSFEEVSRKTGLPISKIKEVTIDFHDDNLTAKDLSKYWQKTFLKAIVEKVAFDIVDIPEDNS